mmetsp:Transcript_6565/g.10381  ORF Transcript_6565/g.10381 Transcript_6565/m.10381 type:complete len:106 (-) Transcript_6565:118-435(-)
MEQTTSTSRTKASRIEALKCMPDEHEKKVLAKKRKLIEVEAKGPVVGEAEGDEEPEEEQPKKRPKKGPKGPNPLSMKKSKESSKKNVPQKKRRRQKKYKAPQEES